MRSNRELRTFVFPLELGKPETFCSEESPLADFLFVARAAKCIDDAILDDDDNERVDGDD